jgi:hypothetical protein
MLNRSLVLETGLGNREGGASDLQAAGQTRVGCSKQMAKPALGSLHRAFPAMVSLQWRGSDYGAQHSGFNRQGRCILGVRCSFRSCSSIPDPSRCHCDSSGPGLQLCKVTASGDVAYLKFALCYKRMGDSSLRGGACERRHTYRGSNCAVHCKFNRV